MNILKTGTTKLSITFSSVFALLALCLFSLSGCGGPSEWGSTDPEIIAVRKQMLAWESQGFRVVESKWLEEIPGYDLDVLIEYVVTDPQTGESWTYTWSYGPPSNVKSHTGTLMNMNNFELTPVSEHAIELNKTLNSIIAGLDDDDASAWERKHGD